MFKIETWVGPKFGGWFAGNRLYPSAQYAECTITEHATSERKSGGSRMTRRVVPA